MSVEFDQLARMVCDHDNAPGGLQSLSGFAAHSDGWIIEARRQPDLHTEAAIVAATKIRAGIVPQICLREGDSCGRCLAKQWRVDHINSANVSRTYRPELALVAGGEVIEFERPAFGVSREVEAGEFVCDLDGCTVLPGRDAVAERHTIVVGTKDKLEGRAISNIDEVKNKLVIAVARAARLARDDGVELVGGAVSCADDSQTIGQVAGITQAQPHG